MLNRRTVLTGLIGFGAGVLAMNNSVLPAYLANLTPRAEAQVSTAAMVGVAPTTGEPIADLVDRVGPAVVNIDTLSRQPNPMQRMNQFMNGMNPNTRMPDVESKGVGSGFIVSANGRILTNDHVVRGTSSLTVTLPDGRKFDGKVIGRDPGQDIALIKIEASNLPTLALAPAGTVRVGQRVIAIGSPLGLTHSVTSGIISAMHRGVEINDRVDFIQTDAPINPGNSGGPLLNMSGQVVGMNTAIISGAQGIGFAIPADTLTIADKELETSGTVARAWIGLQLTDGVPGRGPAIIGGIVPDSPAEKAGLQPGDIVEQINGQRITDSRMIVKTIAKHKVSDRVNLDIRRDGQAMAISVNLAAMPENAG
ncbi:MAG: trypsin-like peptidase domain-containing protein [Candidatus Sericytochromatia bacterium]|nr:trypsin-like peptidase domain-containing protein [Candidatus Sericytochromatia bacterium]